MGNQLNGWPWPGIPTWVIWGPVTGVLAVALAKSRSITSWPVLLAGVWLTYYLISRSGIYFFWPTRHSLLLTPLLMAAAAVGIVAICRWSRVTGLASLTFIVMVCLLAPREGQQNNRGVAQYWLSRRQPGETTYIYYGAAPGFRYQLDLAAGSPSENVPPLWYWECYAGEAAPYCLENDIFYGRWIRQLSPQEKRESVLQTIGFVPERLWLVFSHVHKTENEDMLNVLTADYDIVDKYEVEHGLAYLLEKRP